ncbi:MAG: CBS domain-containing protein [Planctomycetes bacterium]|nr:CBS domain-containing protein [Planctomycetota bacterium]
MLKKPVRDFMSREVYTVDKDTSILEVIREMVRRKTGAAIVTEKDQAIGIFTDRDVLRRVVLDGLDPGDGRVKSVHTPEVVTAGADATLGEVARLMSAGSFRHVPIMDEGRIAGLVSAVDLVRWLGHAPRKGGPQS